jgi:TPR repeat protein
VNETESLKWYQKAAAGGNDYAKDAIGWVIHSHKCDALDNILILTFHMGY